MEQVQIVRRSAQRYVAIPVTVTMRELAAAIDRAFPELFAWLGTRSHTPAGAPFIRYLQVDMDAGLVVELAVPVDLEVAGDGRIRVGVLPAGRYVTLLHVGPYDGLVEANATLQRWAAEHGLRWAMDGAAWRGRGERYLTDPSQQPDPAQWRTEIACLTAEDALEAASTDPGT